MPSPAAIIVISLRSRSPHLCIFQSVVKWINQPLRHLSWKNNGFLVRLVAYYLSVQLSSMALPSISFYTFINTHDSLNRKSISHDGSMVAGGFSDSSLKVWDMAKLGQQSITSKKTGSGIE
ncbi:hypothetical protein C2S51_038859 [Perilla frutescens var. frutescens]|nr:hypothetical protein C2S51_038859 [Perilla frutescens var. frutescens]